MSQIEDRKIERLVADLYNDGNMDMLASTTFNVPDPILDRCDAYEAIVEFSSIDLTNLVLDVDPDYSILILNDEGGKAGNRFPLLPDYVNEFKFQGPLNEVHDLSDWFYEIMHKKTLPESLGNLTITPDGYFRRTVTQAEYDDSFGNGLFKIYVNDGLRRVLPELIQSSDTMSRAGKIYWHLDSSVQDTTQKTDTLAQLLKADSIRFYSTMPTNPYWVQSKAMGQLVRENILTTMAINNETTNILHKTSKRYEPNVYRRFSMVNSQELRDFRVWALIHYTHGRTVMHTLAPGDYMHVALTFMPRQ